VRSLDGITNPFGSRATTDTGTAVRRPSTGATITNNITINEVGDSEATARRVLSRIALAANVV
jgi:hypothetical protein